MISKRSTRIDTDCMRWWLEGKPFSSSVLMYVCLCVCTCLCICVLSRTGEFNSISWFWDNLMGVLFFSLTITSILAALFMAIDNVVLVVRVVIYLCDQTWVVCILLAHLTLLPPDDPPDDDEVFFEFDESSLKLDFTDPVDFLPLRCWRSNELFSSANSDKWNLF